MAALYCIEHIDPLRAEKSIGTLGGGNHFIEADKGEDGSIYIVMDNPCAILHRGIQSGRNIGDSRHRSFSSKNALVKGQKTAGGKIQKGVYVVWIKS